MKTFEYHFDQFWRILEALLVHLGTDFWVDFVCFSTVYRPFIGHDFGFLTFLTLFWIGNLQQLVSDTKETNPFCIKIADIRFMTLQKCPFVALHALKT